MGAVCGAQRDDHAAAKQQERDDVLPEGTEPSDGRRGSDYLNNEEKIGAEWADMRVGQNVTPRGVVVTLLLALLPVCGFIALFSTLGYGIEVHVWVARHPVTVVRAGATTLAIVFLFWFFHISRWFKWVAAPLSLVAFIGGTCVVISSQTSAPSWPLGLLLASFPVYVIAGRTVAEAVSGPLPTYLVFSALWRALVIVAVIVQVWWLCFHARSMFTRGAIPQELGHISHEVGCVPCAISPEWGCYDTGDVGEGGKACILAYMLWINPLLASLGCVLFALLAFSLTEAKEGSVERVFAKSLYVLVAFVWVAVQVAAVAYRFATIVTLWAVCGVAGAFIASWVYSSMALHDYMQGRPLGRDSKTVELTVGHLRIAKRLNAKAANILKDVSGKYGDWALALLIVSPAPLIAAAYVVLDSARHVLLRRKEEPRAVSVIHSYAHHNWSAVLPKAVTICIVFYTLTVGAGKLMVLLLSWLTASLQGLPLGAVIGAYVGAGAVLFLIPAVPATSIFITGGIVVTSAARHTYGYWAGICIATITAFGLKGIAILVQQEGVGRFLASRASVRKMVGVNTVNTRAIRRLMMQRGLTFPKVSVLVGGPDWPTSVLAGILRCDVLQCMLGTIPVIFFLWPPVVMGALSLPNPPMDADQQKLVLAFASLVSLVPLLNAGRAIEREVREHREEIEQEEPDAEVVELETADKRSNAVRAAAIHWKRQNVKAIAYEKPGAADRGGAAGQGHGESQVEYAIEEGWLSPMPWHARALLLAGWLCSWACVTLIAMLDDYCFVVFEITDSIAEKLDGNALNAILPLGWVSFGLLLGAILCMRLFGRWASTEAKKLDSKLDTSPSAPSAQN